MTSNVGTIDRAIRLVLGAMLIVAPFVSGGGAIQSMPGTILALVAGAVLVATSAMRFCPLYKILGIRTCKL